MSKLTTRVLEAAYNDAAIKKSKEVFERYHKPPYTLAVEENGVVSTFGQVEHDDLNVMCGLVMELNAGRAGRGSKGTASKRRWLFVDKKGGQHALNGGSLLKSLGAAELERRSRVYRLLHKDTGKQGYVGPKTEQHSITDPSALRIMQSQLGQTGAM